MYPSREGVHPALLAARDELLGGLGHGPVGIDPGYGQAPGPIGVNPQPAPVAVNPQSADAQTGHMELAHHIGQAHMALGALAHALALRGLS